MKSHELRSIQSDHFGCFSFNPAQYSIVLIRYTTVGKSIMVIITSGYGNHE